MNDHPLITVYITNFNYAKYIRQSIESVLSQSCQDFELFVIDDGSTDDSKNIIEKYRDNEKVSIIYQQNKGLNVTNNVAMRVSSGKYIMRLDADDYLEPDALQEMSRILDHDAELGLVFPDYYYVDASGRRIGEEKRHNFDKEVSLYDQPAHGACTMIRLEFLKKLGGYNESFTCQDGYDLWIKFVTHHKVSNINKSLFSYRRHGENLTGNELRILETRQKIKDDFVNQHYARPKVVAIIPIRNTMFAGESWPMYKIGDETVLDHKITSCLNSKNIDLVVVATSDQVIQRYCFEKYESDPHVEVFDRPENYEAPEKTLAMTFMGVLEKVKQSGLNPDAVLSVSIDYPFLSRGSIDEVINTLVLFNADSVLTVRPDNRTYYKHTGHGMEPILDHNQYTKIERDALYKGVGGLMLTKVNQLIKSGKNISGKVAHVIVDSKSAFEVNDTFTFDSFKILSESDAAFQDKAVTY